MTFLPIALVSGFVGELFGSFAITVSVAMLASLLVSLTVVPVLAYWFLKAPKDAQGVPPHEYRARVEERERNGLLPRVYLPIIKWAVGHRKTVLTGAVVLLVATFAMAGGLKTTFLGDSGQSSITVTQTLPAGTDLATTDTAAKKVETVLADVDGVESYQVVLGSTGGFFGSRTANNVSYTLVLAEDADSSTVTDAVRDKLAAITDAGELKVGGGNGPTGSSKISVSIQAYDDQTLSQATKQVQDALTSVSQVTDVQSDLSESTPQISIVPDGEAAVRYGLTTMSIVSALRQAIDGTTVTQVTLDGTARDVVVQTTTAAPDSLAEVKAITLPTSSGVVRLEQVAAVSQVDGPVQRTHADGKRTNTVSATPVGDNTGAASSAVSEKLKTLTLPEGASYDIGGVTASQSEAFSQLILAMVAAVALVFLVLVGVFCSIRQALVLLVSWRVRPAADHRYAARRGGAYRHPDAHRHRGNQRDRSHGPGEPISRAGHAASGSSRRGRPATLAPDPDDRVGDHLRPAADGVGHHRRGRLHLHAAGRCRHRRPGELDHAHPGADPGALHDGGKSPGTPPGPQAPSRGAVRTARDRSGSGRLTFLSATGLQPGRYASPRVPAGLHHNVSGSGVVDR
jgi:hydrophobic/amphiphilic exporter-1 (mainly G- bacteria), HAE1 family